MRTSVVSTGDGSHEKMEDQVFTWSSISTRKKTVKSGTQTTTKSAILAGSPIMVLPAFSMTIGIAWIMRLTHCQHGCGDLRHTLALRLGDRFYRTNRFS